jgi:hypothetical protein
MIGAGRAVYRPGRPLSDPINPKASLPRTPVGNGDQRLGELNKSLMVLTARRGYLLKPETLTRAAKPRGVAKVIVNRQPRPLDDRRGKNR